MTSTRDPLDLPIAEDPPERRLNVDDLLVLSLRRQLSDVGDEIGRTKRVLSGLRVALIVVMVVVLVDGILSSPAVRETVLNVADETFLLARDTSAFVSDLSNREVALPSQHQESEVSAPEVPAPEVQKSEGPAPAPPVPASPPAKPAATAPETPKPVTPKPVTPIPVAPASLPAEPAATTPETLKPVAPSPVAPAPAPATPNASAPMFAAPEPAVPEPVTSTPSAPEVLTPEPLKPKPLTPRPLPVPPATEAATSTPPAPEPLTPRPLIPRPTTSGSTTSGSTSSGQTTSGPVTSAPLASEPPTPSPQTPEPEPLKPRPLTPRPIHSATSEAIPGADPAKSATTEAAPAQDPSKSQTDTSDPRKSDPGTSKIAASEPSEPAESSPLVSTLTDSSLPSQTFSLTPPALKTTALQPPDTSDAEAEPTEPTSESKPAPSKPEAPDVKAPDVTAKLEVPAKPNEASPADAGREPGFTEAFLSAKRMLERRLTPEEKAEPTDPTYLDAMMRIEGIYDPTRVGVFGDALRMRVRPGTMSMTNVFGDGWTRAVPDPNVHYRVQYQAETWLNPKRPKCENFWRFRPNYSLVSLDKLGPRDCKSLQAALERGGDRLADDKIVPAPLSVPTFAAPYPGGRMSSAELRAALQEKIQAAKDRLWGQKLSPN